jgi:Arc/MetJ-type ribon-helix-helix transcriptional regulator
MKAKPKRRTPSKSKSDIACTVRLPRQTLRLIKQWQQIFGYADRSAVVRAILALGLHAASEQWDAALS